MNFTSGIYFSSRFDVMNEHTFTCVQGKVVNGEISLS